jgi:heme/copper-type cytochrome/quinol oxidase subunit 2
VTPTEAGDFRIVCNEFCGVGHHVMVGRVEVIDPAAASTDEGAEELTLNAPDEGGEDDR